MNDSLTETLEKYAIATYLPDGTCVKGPHKGTDTVIIEVDRVQGTVQVHELKSSGSVPLPMYPGVQIDKVEIARSADGKVICMLETADGQVIQVGEKTRTTAYRQLTKDIAEFFGTAEA